MIQYTTPGVYIVENNTPGGSVVPVATGVPAFVGYTQKARRDASDLTNRPTRLSSMAQFEEWFGGPPRTQVRMLPGLAGTATCEAVRETQFFLYHGMRMFFANGGGACWVVSVGGYASADLTTTRTAQDFHAAWDALEKESEPTIIVVPDAVLLSPADYAVVSNDALQHCGRLKSRVAILDVYDGFKPRTLDATDVISGAQGFRNVIHGHDLSYGMAYYPWLNALVPEPADVDFRNLDGPSRLLLGDEVEESLSSQMTPELSALVARLRAVEDADVDVAGTLAAEHNALMAVSSIYRDVMGLVRATLSVMPPSAAMAGIMVMTDNSRGVHKAPANVGIASVLSPTVSVSQRDQEDLNAPLDGKSINAIRTFPGKGVVVWGARTLAGNSNEWRYISVRRTLIMMEQSIILALRPYVFAPNTASTWAVIKAMLDHFLLGQWRSGALAGAKADEAYSVSIGLGATMTAQDVLEGWLRLTVAVALVRPAEYMVLNFSQKMHSA